MNEWVFWVKTNVYFYTEHWNFRNFWLENSWKFLENSEKILEKFFFGNCWKNFLRNFQEFFFRNFIVFSLDLFFTCTGFKRAILSNSLVQISPYYTQILLSNQFSDLTLSPEFNEKLDIGKIRSVCDFFAISGLDLITGKTEMRKIDIVAGTFEQRFKHIYQTKGEEGNQSCELLWCLCQNN